MEQKELVEAVDKVRAHYQVFCNNSLRRKCVAAVIGIAVINDIANIYGEGESGAKLEYPQTIAFRTDSGVIMLDKEVWFSELIVIKKGEGIDALLYDESVNWEDDLEEDTTTHFEFRTETQEL